MAQECKLCGKGAMFGNKICRRGLAVKKGGVGQNTTGISPRKFYPNLQRVKANIKGTIKYVRVCARCLKSGNLIKA